MSLVVTCWSPSVGIAVCEGRVGAWRNGEYVSIAEDCSKLTRLPNGGILGIAGHSREGFKKYASLLSVCADYLRPSIISASNGAGFRELSQAIPELLAECAGRWPELFFCVSLLGVDGGIVRGGAWDSDGASSVPTSTDPTWIVLSPSAEIGKIVDSAIRSFIGHFGFQDPAFVSAGIESIPAFVSAGIESIVRGFAARYPDINDRTFVEFITAHVPVPESALPQCMNASNITAGTMSANKVLFPDGSALTTASRVLTAKASPTGGLTTTTSMQAVPGFGFTATAGSTADVYNVSATIDIAPVSAVSQGVTISLVLDGNTASPLQSFTYWVNPSTPNHNFVPFVASVTGLSAGSHTLSFYAAATVYNSSTAVSSTSYAICQRIF